MRKKTKLIFKKNFPASMFRAITFLRTIYYRLEEKYRNRLRDHVAELFGLVEHERTHLEQKKETLFIGFYIIYAIEWILKIPTLRPYRNISFEREARANAKEHDNYDTFFSYDDNYIMKKIEFIPREEKGSLIKRKHYAWVHYIFHES